MEFENYLALGPSSLSSTGNLTVQLIDPENGEYAGIFIELQAHGLRKSEIDKLTGMTLTTYEDLVACGLDKLACHDLFSLTTVTDYIRSTREHQSLILAMTDI